MSVKRGSESLEVLNQLEIVVREQGTTIVIELAGECDLAGAAAVRQAIAAALAGRPEYVVFDLSRLTFMDSTGLHITIELAQRADVENARLVIIPGPPAVQRLFDIAGVTERLPLIGKQPKGSRDARPRTAPDGAARSDGFSLPPNGAGRRSNAPGVTRSASQGKPAA